MKANVLNQYKHLDWQDVEDPSPGDHDVVVQVKFAGICGSDEHIFHGDFPDRIKLPLIPGHEFGGIVIEAGKYVKNLKMGDSIAVDPIIWCGKTLSSMHKFKTGWNGSEWWIL
ncbi:alcohol dehydrogenase catalytic domain-containing protein [Bacteroidota bacterium]